MIAHEVRLITETGIAVVFARHSVRTAKLAAAGTGVEGDHPLGT
jgi:hypothetical protein